jgi:PD-(D/E)XK nuclease superfamily/Domain of unknown function (DUF2357)
MASPSTASPPISKFRFLSEEGVPQKGPLEWARAQIAVDCPAGSLAAARLSRNDTPLPLSERVINGSVELVADWPLSGAGHYELQLELGGELVEVSRWTVEPAKLSAAAFWDLLDDLENRLPVTVALTMQKLGAFAGVRLIQPAGASSVAEEIARLRRVVTKTAAGPGLAWILREIGQDPHQVLADVEMWVPAERARRVSATGLVRAVALGSNTAPGVPDRLPDNRVEATVDVYENRLLKAFVEQVELRLRRLRPLLSASNSNSLTHELDALERELYAARSQASFLLEVGRLGQTPTNVTMVLIKKPAYRKLLEAFLDFRSRTAVRLNEPALEAPLENLPSLYETWGVLHAIRAILELGAENGYRIKRNELFRHGPVGSWIEVLPNGRPAVILERSSDDRTISVVPQRTYSTVGNGLKSITYPQRPDLSVEVVRPQNPTEIYLIDPKYKLESEPSTEAPSDGKPKKVDIDKMHAYRDAIRDQQGKRIVKFAGILYPGPRQIFTPGLAALSAVPGGTELMDQLRQVFAPAFD